MEVRRGDGEGLMNLAGVSYPSNPLIFNSPNWGNLEGEGFHSN